MGAFEAILLGIVQGLTEFLPISSTGHIRIVSAICGWDDPGSGFTAVIQLGTMIAVLIFFREDLWRIAKATLASLRTERWRTRDVDARMGWYIVLGTIPIAVVGLALHNVIEDDLRGLYLIGAALVLFSLVMLRAEAAGSRRRPLAEITPNDGMRIGLAQTLSLIPGVSRSGATISAGLFCGFEREAAARYSFLLSVPAVVLSGLFELKDVGSGDSPGAVPTVLATILAFALGYWSIGWMLRFVGSHSIGTFCGYRVAAGLLVIVLAAAGLIG